MNRWVKVLLVTGISFLLCLIFFSLLSNFNIDNKMHENLNMLALVLSICLSLVIVNAISRKREEVIEVNSEKVKQIEELNKNFKKISSKKHNVLEREYSRKSLDRVNGDDVIKYHIENDIKGLRTDIENSIYNISLLDEYEKNVAKILEQESVNKTKYSDKKYKRIENIVLDKIIYTKKDFLINASLEVYYRSNGGRVNESRNGFRNYEELLELYKEWENGNKYEVTKRQERKIMNDDIRYNVLKRDNFTCQKCGITSKDGAKLEVDHIIPVSKGGKTVMSNLQTLCDRCNSGKSDKTKEDFETNDVCPRCGGTLVKRSGKYGAFMGCSNYPKCRYIKK